MNGYVNIQIKLKAGEASKQVNTLRRNLDGLEKSYSKAASTAASVGAIEFIKSDQIKNMREGGQAATYIHTRFKVLLGTMREIQKVQAIIANRPFIRKDQTTNVTSMTTAIKGLSAALVDYKTKSNGISKVQFFTSSQSRDLRLLATALEGIEKRLIDVRQESEKNNNVGFATARQVQSVRQLRDELTGLRTTLNSTNKAAARSAATPVVASGVTVGASAAAGAGMVASQAAAGKAVRETTRSIQGQQSALVRHGSQIQWAGRQLQYNFTLPIAFAGAAALKFAMDQEKAMTQVAKVYGDSTEAAQWWSKQQEMRGKTAEQVSSHVQKVFEDELQALDEYFTAASTYFGQSKADVLDTAAAWAAAGQSGAALAASVKSSLEAAVFGDMSLADATKSLIAIQAQYNLSSQELSETLAYLNAVENQTGAGMSDLIDAFSRSAATARAAGIDQRHLAANIAALVPAAGTAANAGNGLKSIIQDLTPKTKPARAAMEGLGLDIDSVAYASMNGQEKLILLAEKFDELSAAQRTTVAKNIFGKWQANRAIALMTDLVRENGYYNKALDATATKEKALAQMTKELNTVLDSNPRRLQRIGVALQNSLVEIITPLIPAILYVGESIAFLTQKFQQLDPNLQKLLIWAAGFLVVMPLLVRYLGAMMVLFGYLGNTARVLGTVMLTTGKMIRFALLIPFAPIAALWTAGMTLLAGTVGFLVTNVNRILLVGRGIWAATMAVTWALISLLSMRSLASLGFLLTGLWTKIWAAMRTIAMTGALATQAIMASIGGIVPLLQRIGMAMVAALASPWTLLVVAVVAVLYAFRDTIAAVWNNIVESVANGGLGEIIDSMVAGIHAAFNSLPSGVQNALMAVVNMVKAAALAVYEWFSYINPWAHHSPSLVENVTTGMSAVVSQFSSLGKIKRYTDAAYKEVNKFGKATANITGRAGRMEVREDRTSIRKAGGSASALKQYDQLQGRLKGLNRLYDQIGKQVERMQDRIDGPMRVMEDRIFANEQAQKKYRLELLKLEQTLGPLDELEDKLGRVRDQIASIDDEQQQLKDIQADLRAAGAGSDILSFYDDQIKALEGQRKPLAEQESSIQKSIDKFDALNKKLDDLSRQGEILNLEKSLQFDGPLRQIDLMKEKYDLVGQSISDIESRMNAVVSASEKINQAADAARQKREQAKKAAKAGGAAGASGIPGAGMGVAGEFAEVGGKSGLADRTSWASEADAINQLTDDLINDTTAAFGKINPFEAVKKKWGEFKSWLSGQLPSMPNVWDSIMGGSDKSNAVADSFKNTWNKVWGGIQGFLGVIKGVGSMIWTLLGKEIVDTWNVIVGVFQDAWKILGPEIMAWGKDLKPIGQALLAIAAVAAFAATLIIKMLLNVFNMAIRPLLQGFFLLLRGVSMIVRGVLKFFAGMINAIVGVFTGDGDKVKRAFIDMGMGALEAFLGVFVGLGGAIWGIVGGALGVVVGLFKNIWRLIVAGAEWLYDVLVGHSIIPDLVDAIVAVFKTLAAIVGWLWNYVFRPIVNLAVKLFNLVVAGFRLWWAGITLAFAVLKTLGTWFWNYVLKPVWAAVMKLWGWVKAAFGRWWNGIKTIWNGLKKLGGWFWDNVLRPVASKAGDLWTRVKTGFGRWWEGIKTAFSALKRLGSWFWDNVLSPVLGKFKDLFLKIKNWISDNTSMILKPFTSLVNLIITAINKMISGLNKVSDVLPGIDFKINPIPKLAKGGPIPERMVGNGFVTNGARAIVGEGKANHPEFVIPTDPTYRSRALALYEKLGQKLRRGHSAGIDKFMADGDQPNINGVPMYFGGGILDGIQNAWGKAKKIGKGTLALGSKVAGYGTDAMKFLADHARDAASFLYKPFGKYVDNKIDDIGWRFGRSLARNGHNNVKRFIGGTDEYMEEVYKAANGKWVKPLQGNYSIGGGLGSYAGHNGQDFPTHIGNQVRAITGGKITGSYDIGPKKGGRNSNGYGSYGRVVELTNSQGYKFLMAHNSIRSVLKGEQVAAGETLARSGNTGNSSGPHLHVSIWKDGKLKEPMDVLRSHGVRMAEGGIAKARPGGVAATIAEGGQDEAVIPLPNGFDIRDLSRGSGDGTVDNSTHTYHVQLVLPNITSGDDAEELLRNLEAITDKDL